MAFLNFICFWAAQLLIWKKWRGCSDSSIMVTMNIPSGRLGSNLHCRPWSLLWPRRVASSSSEEKFWCQISRTWGPSFELGIGRDRRFGWHVQFLLLGIQVVSSAHHESPEQMIKTASQWIGQLPSQGLCGVYGATCFVFPELLGHFKTRFDGVDLALRVLIPCKTLCFKVLCRFGKLNEAVHPRSRACCIYTHSPLLGPIWSK